MSKEQHSLPKRIALNILGALLIIIAPVLGPLPGPGGIPLFLAGLGLLALNNEWAERWLNYLKKHGNNVLESIFTGSRRKLRSFDVAGVLILIAGVTTLVLHNSTFIKGLMIWAIGLALFILLANDERYKKIRK